MSKVGAQVEIAHGVYKPVAAGQTGASLSAAGKVGDVINRVIIVPTTTAAGSVTIIDGATSTVIFTGGGTLTDLRSWVVELNAASREGAWTITTGANVAVIVVGQFSTQAG